MAVHQSAISGMYLKPFPSIMPAYHAGYGSKLRMIVLSDSSLLKKRYRAYERPRGSVRWRAQRALKYGVNPLAKAVKVTLEPRGCAAVLEKKCGVPTLIHDEIAGAREIRAGAPPLRGKHPLPSAQSSNGAAENAPPSGIYRYKGDAMIRTVQISFRNMEASEAVAEKIREEAENLATYYDRIISCRVVVEVPHRRHERGNLYQVRIDMTVPGGELIVKHAPSLHGASERAGVTEGPKKFEAHTPHKNVLVAIHDAFDTARRQLQDYARRQRGVVKTHEPPSYAHVVRLFPEDDYGFLETPDGVEVYFHRNSVWNAGFDQLEAGTEVAFVVEEGEDGLQASTVRIAR